MRDESFARREPALDDLKDGAQPCAKRADGWRFCGDRFGAEPCLDFQSSIRVTENGARYQDQRRQPRLELGELLQPRSVLGPKRLFKHRRETRQGATLRFPGAMASGQDLGIGEGRIVFQNLAQLRQRLGFRCRTGFAFQPEPKPSHIARSQNRFQRRIGLKGLRSGRRRKRLCECNAPQSQGPALIKMVLQLQQSTAMGIQFEASPNRISCEFILAFLGVETRTQRVGNGVFKSRAEYSVDDGDGFRDVILGDQKLGQSRSWVNALGEPSDRVPEQRFSIAAPIRLPGEQTRKLIVALNVVAKPVHEFPTNQFGGFQLTICRERVSPERPQKRVARRPSDPLPRQELRFASASVPIVTAPIDQRLAYNMGGSHEISGVAGLAHETTMRFEKSINPRPYIDKWLAEPRDEASCFLGRG